MLYCVHYKDCLDRETVLCTMNLCRSVAMLKCCCVDVAVHMHDVTVYALNYMHITCLHKQLIALVSH